MSKRSRGYMYYFNVYEHVRYHPITNLSKFGDNWFKYAIIIGNLMLEPRFHVKIVT